MKKFFFNSSTFFLLLLSQQGSVHPATEAASAGSSVLLAIFRVASTKAREKWTRTGKFEKYQKRKTDPSKEKRAKAVAFFGMFGAEHEDLAGACLDELKEMFEDGDPLVRAAAERSFRELCKKHDFLKERLLEYLRDKFEQYKALKSSPDVSGRRRAAVFFCMFGVRTSEFRRACFDALTNMIEAAGEDEDINVILNIVMGIVMLCSASEDLQSRGLGILSGADSKTLEGITQKCIDAIEPFELTHTESAKLFILKLQELTKRIKKDEEKCAVM